MLYRNRACSNRCTLYGGGGRGRNAKKPTIFYKKKNCMQITVPIMMGLIPTRVQYSDSRTEKTDDDDDDDDDDNNNFQEPNKTE